MSPFAPPVASRSILACRDSCVAGLSTRYAGAHAAPASEPSGETASGINALPPPSGVAMRVYEGLPGMVTPLARRSMSAIHREAVSSAWSQGAWDVKVSMVPPLSGPELGLVTENRDWSGCDPGLCPALIDAAERGRLVVWLWLPMQGGPALRRAGHALKDRTLLPDGGRTGEPPDGLREPDWRWRRSREWMVRLGTWADEHRPKPRRPASRVARPGLPRHSETLPATEAQRAYLKVLHVRSGRPCDLPADLSKTEASVWIGILS